MATSPRLLGLVGPALFVVAALAVPSAAGAEGALATGPSPGGEPAHEVPHLLWSLPFAGLLLAIAVLPLVPSAHPWWERNAVKLLVGLALSVVVLGHYAVRGFGYHDADPGWPSVAAVLEHAILGDYLPFLVLLLSLYVISGGLQLRGNLVALPRVNAGILALGACLASFIGTTGASMVLIRPLLQTNRERQHVRHTVIFFIFLVSNIGGCLLPIGDPPLFLGYLQGVPFLWTLRLIPAWAFCLVVLLAVYFLWDTLAYRRETRGHRADDLRSTSRPSLHGRINLLWLLGVVLSVALIVPGKPLPGTVVIARDFLREGVMLVLTALSLATTPRGLRRETQFNYHAILEVAALFLGIFLTMQVPIEILQARGRTLGLDAPIHYFWATGLLSSVLDNAPTYVVFLETAKTLPVGDAAVVLVNDGAIRDDLLRAISLGAVFMGANTYIGNGPNFMVKSIAEQSGVAMPGFFGYMLYSGSILIPVFVLVSLIFCR